MYKILSDFSCIQIRGGIERAFNLGQGSKGGRKWLESPENTLRDDHFKSVMNSRGCFVQGGVDANIIKVCLRTPLVGWKRVRLCERGLNSTTPIRF